MVMQGNGEKRGNELLFDSHIKEQDDEERDWGAETRLAADRRRKEYKTVATRRKSRQVERKNVLFCYILTSAVQR